jgi:hypothetical protein
LLHPCCFLAASFLLPVRWRITPISRRGQPRELKRSWWGHPDKYLHEPGRPILLKLLQFFRFPAKVRKKICEFNMPVLWSFAIDIWR